jgi:DNA-binding NarL/FixJ family response regulator
VVLMDIRMPGTDGLQATRQIAADPGLSGVRVIILTTFEADEYVFEAIHAGASGFLVKDTEPEDLIRPVLTSLRTLMPPPKAVPARARPGQRAPRGDRHQDRVHPCRYLARRREIRGGLRCMARRHVVMATPGRERLR